MIPYLDSETRYWDACTIRGWWRSKRARRGRASPCYDTFPVPGSRPEGEAYHYQQAETALAQGGRRQAIASLRWPGSIWTRTAYSGRPLAQAEARRGQRILTPSILFGNRRFPGQRGQASQAEYRCAGPPWTPETTRRPYAVERCGYATARTKPIGRGIAGKGR